MGELSAAEGRPMDRMERLAARVAADRRGRDVTTEEARVVRMLEKMCYELNGLKRAVAGFGAR